MFSRLDRSMTVTFVAVIRELDETYLKIQRTDQDRHNRKAQKKAGKKTGDRIQGRRRR